MLTEPEQEQIFRWTLELVKLNVRLKTFVKKGMTDPRRATETWNRKLDEFKGRLKEIGDVPMPTLPVAKGDVGKSGKAQTKDRPSAV